MAWTSPPGDWVLTNGVWVPFQAERVFQPVVFWLLPIVGLFLLGVWLWRDAERREAERRRGTEGGTNVVEAVLGCSSRLYRK
jgi:hypothetical protein